jgi:hypothetical protein
MADAFFEGIGLIGYAIFDQFDAYHEAALTDVADVRVIG